MILYYLLYKINQHHLLWIVKTAPEYYTLKDHIKNYRSTMDKYYIVKRFVSAKYVEEELNLKQFNIFKTHKFDIILDETIIIR